jgi:transcriptional regulator with XRE-family HTH domain
MILLITPLKAQRILANHIRTRRLAMDLTQDGLAKRSGVPLATLRKFEQHGVLSLEGFLKLVMVVGGMEQVLVALEPQETEFSSIDDVLNADKGKTKRKRGRQA